ATRPRSARSPSAPKQPSTRADHLTRQRAAQARPQAPRPALAGQAWAVRRGGGGPRRCRERNAGRPARRRRERRAVAPGGGLDAPSGMRVALVPRAETPLPELELDGDVVFVLGAERDGLPPEVLERCDVRASIPQTGGTESLNVAMAGTIALYELARRPA